MSDENWIQRAQQAEYENEKLREQLAQAVAAGTKAMLVAEKWAAEAEKLAGLLKRALELLEQRREGVK